MHFVVINDALNYIVRCERDMKDHKYAHLEPVELFHKAVIHHLRLCHPESLRRRMIRAPKHSVKTLLLGLMFINLVFI